MPEAFREFALSIVAICVFSGVSDILTNDDDCAYGLGSICSLSIAVSVLRMLERILLN